MTSIDNPTQGTFYTATAVAIVDVPAGCSVATAPSGVLPILGAVVVGRLEGNEFNQGI